MRKSVKIRKIIFDVLWSIQQQSINFDEAITLFTKNINLEIQDKSMIYNISLNSMRNNIFINEILNKYLKKKTSLKIKTLLLSAITQILYLDFKEYAVTNDTVEIAKLKKLNPALVNSLLKKIITDKSNINKYQFKESYIPFWLLKNFEKGKDINIKNFVHNISNEPSLHLVFKNKKLLNKFNEEHFKTSPSSAFLLNKKIIKNIEGYSEGSWWVQDFSTMLPIYLSPEIKNKNILDLCSAPGGKTFQSSSLGCKIEANDINVKRLEILKSNLKRLNLDVKISNYNVLEMPERKKYDVVILDAPCSGIGTIRRNPEILFKKKPPNINKLAKLQYLMIKKASNLIKKNGLLIYMVCSFLYDETFAIKNKFLTNNINFTHKKFIYKTENNFTKFINNEGDIYCKPQQYGDYFIDGFYAAKFLNND